MALSRFCWYRAFTGFTCQAPVFALFFLSRGVDYEGLMLLALAFAAAKFACDVPCGVFSDRFGRRSALLGRVSLESISVGLLFFDQFLLSSILAGAALSFSSSAEAALVYEWDPERFSRDFGRAASWGHLSTAVAAMAGAGLAAWDFSAVYVLRFAALILAGGTILTLPEGRAPARAPAESSPTPLSRILLFAGIIGAVHVAALQLQQPYLRSCGIPLEALGALFVAFQLATAAGARVAHRIPGVLWVVAGGSIAGFAAMALPIGAAGVVAVLGHKFMYGISMPSLAARMNRGAAPGRRAATLSLRSLSEGAVLMLAAPGMGWAAQSWSLHAAFALAACMILPAFFFTESPWTSPAGSPS